ncbi:MAG TPA: histidinol-phosphate transaminase [Solirubrobacteraceae bacterium]|jgi:histidinol-phosphate aminotransferase
MTTLSSLLRRSVLGAGPYVPGASAHETRERLGRDDLVRLNWNENLSGPLPGVVEETAAALPDVWAYPEEAYEDLRTAIAAWTGAGRGEVVLGHGIQALTLTLISAFVEPGDRVVVPRPTYGLYAQACTVAGAEVHRIDVTPALGLDLEAVAAAATSVSAKLVWICDPNNPTGLRLDAGEWSDFLDALPDGCLAIADEAYVDYVDPADRIDRLADIRASRPVVVLRTFSKVFGLAGLRLGYLLVHESLSPHIDAVQEPFNVNHAALTAGLASLRRGHLVEGRRVEAVQARRRLTEPLAGSGIEPVDSSANFVLLRIPGDDLEAADTLARDGLLVRAGTEFGLPGYLRVTLAQEELMDRVAAALVAAVRAGVGPR